MTTTAPGQTAATTGYQYDAGGNTTCRPTAGSASNNCGTSTNSQTLGWDAEGKLSTVTAGSTALETNVYDTDGNRLIRRDATGTTLYLPGQEIRKQGTVVTGTRYYALAGTTIGSRTGASAITDLTWLFTDHQGTHQIAVNAGTQTVTIRRQTPYGGARGTSPAWVNGRGFVGGDNDPTGLVNIGARQYDQLLGRFVSVDPLMDLANPQQRNGYAYASNNPITKSDPSGLIERFEGGSGCGQWAVDPLGNCIDPNKKSVDHQFTTMKCTAGDLGVCKELAASAGCANLDGNCVGHAIFYIAIAALTDGAGRIAADLADATAATVETAGAAEAGATEVEAVAPGAGSVSKGPVNKVGGENNCTSCAIAGDSTLAGSPASAILYKEDLGFPYGLQEIERYAGSRFYWTSGRAAIEKKLLNAGEGARGIVYGARRAPQLNNV